MKTGKKIFWPAVSAVLYLIFAALILLEIIAFMRPAPADPVAVHSVAVQGAVIERDPEDVLKAACHAICDNADGYDNDYPPVRLCDELLVYYEKKGCFAP